MILKTEEPPKSTVENFLTTLFSAKNATFSSLMRDLKIFKKAKQLMYLFIYKTHLEIMI